MFVLDCHCAAAVYVSSDHNTAQHSRGLASDQSLINASVVGQRSNKATGLLDVVYWLSRLARPAAAAEFNVICLTSLVTHLNARTRART